jgi:ribose 5-phosphate isomerase RpiB
MIVTERAESMKDWLAENVFAPIGFVPRFDERGLLYPVPDSIPPVGFLPVIDEDVGIFGEGSWEHGAENAVHEVDFTYLREYIAVVDGGEVLASREVRTRIVSPISREVIADPVEYRPVTVRSTGTGPGALLGNVTAEIGSVLARQRADALLTRYRFGAPVLSLPVRSGDPTAAALLVGDWVRVQLPWLPDYDTGIRGIDRVMQVTGSVDQNVAVRVLTLTDGYPAGSAPSLPIFGTITFDEAGRALIPITSVPSGGTVRVEYSVTQLQPEETSSLWVLGGNLASPGIVATTVVPPGGIVWARARSSTADGQPSEWVVAAAVQAGVAPFIFGVAVSPAGSGYSASWTVTPQTLGVRLEWGVHDPLVAPTYTDSLDVAASAGSALLPVTLTAGQRLTVRAEPWSGFAGGAVDGSAGTPTVGSYTFVDVDQAFLTSAGATNTGAGSCPDGLPITVSWVGGGTGYATDYTVTVQRRVTALNPPVFEDLLTRASGVDPSTGSYADLYANHTRDDAGQFTTFDYRVRLVHTASGLVVSERMTNAIGVNCQVCP